ncbi:MULTISPECIES: bifunctional enoyl-CoA hydratase/phosphate acetyltransferase [unclassified Haematospirillum]|uniref:bifunctional enoyl-CoA hydratase/phosphate acetyltransferase n=1 Tax=unclassified Haematospirillum TaxID=2622088 RepID=UPI00143C1E18|nr:MULTISPECIES: bifunctional enoyl-CoA hydratase/phosphate acetyltransferase [unclassified Haematospirillum]NKD54053.1 bifunctional enoyl-CoA hydratase/phosphate acetyltransferase [Haematospirillum sp. H4890]NKD74098.1 bifunctional enoyl-CoA hydratase/phosphate acetyltransferase [Haematospirillum sp. H4485]NKD87232.1 bifunctional enoyl-CoA hydratase/phosphate acetyltransferase [Haematospirillum sp. 15-248]
MRITLQNRTFSEICIGDTASLTRTLTREDAEVFAIMSSDHNPTHLDDAWAAKLLKNGKVSGHSMWAGSLFSSLLGNELPGPGTVYREQTLRFLRAVELGDTLTLTLTATEKREDEHIIVFHCQGVNQRHEMVVEGYATVEAPIEKVTVSADPLPEITVRRRSHVFSRLLETTQATEPVKVAVCHPCDEVSLTGAMDAAKHGVITPVLIGPSKRIRSIAREFGINIDGCRIIDTEHSHASASTAVGLCRTGECEALMKGSLHTDELMHEVAKGDTGLRTGRRISHVYIIDTPAYPKPLFITDAAINIYPSLQDKADICQNAIDLVRIMGVEQPLVAILSAVETVYPKITSTIEAAALCKMADRGQIRGGILDGPLAFDNAISSEAARIKNISSPVAGNADILLVPDLEAGNMLAKQLCYLAEAEAAGVVLGARVPIILTSRADSAKARLASCVVAARYAQARRTGKQKLVTGVG